MIYLDNAATTPVLPAALEAAWPYLTGEFGNPSSTHELGHRAAGALTDARARVARWFDCKPSEVVFTSGGTEGDNLGITGLALANPRGKHIISALTEHEAVLQTLDYLARVHAFEITWLPVDRQGQISLADLRQALRPDTTLVTLMLVNNEIGTAHPIPEIVELAHAVGALVHTDAVQAPGWYDCRISMLGVDALTISGHKLGAPKGSGAVYLRSRLAVEPLLHGGGQERERRSGTENVAWAVALATALEALPAEPELEAARMSALRDEFIAEVLHRIRPSGLSGEAIEPHDGHASRRHPAIASFTFPGINGETLLLALEERGIVVSSGSACAAGSDDPSHVLMACGYDEELARTSVRFSFAHSTSAKDLSHAALMLREAYQSVRTSCG
jgi:cysteine desulfurase